MLRPSFSLAREALTQRMNRVKLDGSDGLLTNQMTLTALIIDSGSGSTQQPRTP